MPCKEDGCTVKNPSFNFKDKTIGIYCKKHLKENMVDVIHKKCLEDKCLTQPSFNFATETTALYCSTHKKDDMIDILNRRKYCI